VRRLKFLAVALLLWASAVSGETIRINDLDDCAWRARDAAALERCAAETGRPDVRSRIDEVLTLKKKFYEALQSPEAASAIPPLLRFDSPWVQLYMIQALEKGGPNGVAALLAILKDETLLYSHQATVVSLAGARATDAAPQLLELLKTDHAYFKSIANELPERWLASDGYDVQCRYGRMRLTIHALRCLHYAEARDTVLEVRALWDLVPQMRWVEDREVLQECEWFLAGR
jgi:hypothetical protein